MGEDGLELAFDQVDLTDVLRHAVRINQAALDKMGRRVDLIVCRDNCSIFGDELRLLQILDSVLKYTIGSSPVDADVRILLRRDRGVIEIGILSALLVSCGAAPAGGAFSRAGTGVHADSAAELALVSALVHLHGGTFAMSCPDDGEGASFTIRFMADHHRE